MGSADTRRRAAEWLVELETTDDVRALLPAFDAWLREAPENHAAYRELQEAWHMTARVMSSTGQLRVERAAQLLDKSRAAARKRQLRRKLSVAGFAGAASTAGAVLWVVLTSRLTLNHDWTQYAASYGERPSITLPDGSLIRLNTQSLIWVRETSRARSVRLQDGEALFAVAADRSRPFTVSVGSVVLQAIGTEFSVRRESEGVVDALVSKGSIEVLPHGGQGVSQGDSSAESRVAAGEAIRITPSRVEIARIGSLGVRQRLAWTVGMIDFEGTLAEAVSEFNRYNSRRLVIVDPSIAARHIQGFFKATDPDAFARELQRALGIPYSVTPVASANSGVISLGVTR